MIFLGDENINITKSFFLQIYETLKKDVKRKKKNVFITVMNLNNRNKIKV